MAKGQRPKHHETPDCAELLRRIGSARAVMGAAGITSTGSVSKWRSGKSRPSLGTLFQIIDALLPIDEFVPRGMRSYYTEDEGRQTRGVPVGVGEYTRRAAAGLFADDCPNI